MKKGLFILSLLLLVACGGETYKIYTIADKQKMILKVLNEKDENLRKEIKENIENLKKAVEKNDEKAQKELEAWQMLMIVHGKI